MNVFDSASPGPDDAALLARIAHVLVSGVDVPLALREVCGLAARACRADRASLYLVDPEAAECIPAMSQFADRRLDDVWPEFGSGRRRAVRDLPFISHLVTTQTPLAIDDARTSDTIEPIWVQRFGLKSVLGVPLAMGGRVIGVLVLDTVDAVRPFGPHQQTLAQAVADQLTLVIHERVLLERLEVAERLRETEGLLALAGELGGTLDRVELARRAAREVTRLLGADTTIVLRFDMQTGTAKPMAGHHVPEGLRGPREYAVTTGEMDETVIEAFRTGHPLACPDATVDRRFDHPFISFLPRRPRGLVVIPLLARGLPYGAVVSYWWERRHVLSKGGLRVAAGVASQVSLALQNAEFYREATRALADLKTAQEQLVRGETLRALGELAHGAAHHLNNLLAVVIGGVQLLLRNNPDDGGRRGLALVERAAQDAAEVVRRVQEFARAQPEHRGEMVDLCRVVAEAVEMTRARCEDPASLPHVAIDVKQDLAAVPPVDGDVVALRETMLNLLLNAVDALPDGGMILVTTRHTGRSIHVTVRDTGVGMAPGVRQRAMDPFFTTKDPRRTGLGLSAAYGIVTRHRGTLSVESAEGTGTTVTVELPVAATAVVDTPDSLAPARDDYAA